MKLAFALPIAALALTLTGCGTATSSNSGTATSQPGAALTPTRAYSFVDSLGVNTHIFFTGSAFSAYANPAVAESALTYLGFPYVRDGAANLPSTNAAKLAVVANATGIKYDFALGSGGTVDINATLAGVHTLLAAAPGSVASIEGSNEINNVFEAPAWAVTYGGATVDICAHSYAPVVAEQKDLYTAVHQDALLHNVQVYNFSVVNLTGVIVNGCTGNEAADLANIGDVSASADYENLHSYPYQGAAPGATYAAAISAADPVHGKPVVFTETGYSTGQSASATPYLAVDETVQAKYELDAILDLYRLGVTRTFLYELLDDAPDSPATSTEYHYGMFHSDGTPKPTATGFHNLLTILKDGGATAATFTPSSVALTLTQTITASAIRDANTYHVLLQKADGTNEFIVWGEPALWNTATKSEYPLFTVNTVTLDLGKTYSTVNVYDPMISTTPIQQASNTSTVIFNVLDHPVVAEFH